jgi:hypothetical protein
MSINSADSLINVFGYKDALLVQTDQVSTLKITKRTNDDR